MKQYTHLRSLKNHRVGNLLSEFHPLRVGLAFVLVLSFVSCDESSVFPSHPIDDNIIEPPIAVDTTGMNIPAEAITVEQARRIGDSIGNGGTTTEKYYIKGFVKKFHTSSTPGKSHADAMADFGNGMFYMVDNPKFNEDFYAYQVYGIDQEKFTSLDQIEVGDYVVVHTYITNYNGTIESTGKGEGYVYSSNNLKAYPMKQFFYLQDDFANGLGNWEVRNVSNADGMNIWTAATTGGKTCAQASCSATAAPSSDIEVWLVSPTMNLSEQQAVSPTFSFNHYHLQAGNVSEQLTVMLSSDGENWQRADNMNYSSGFNPPRYVNTAINLEKYVGKSTQVAFVYKSVASSVPMWYITKVEVFENRHARN